MSTEMWDQRYGGPGFAYGEAPNDWLKQEADRLAHAAGKKVLALAEGEGRNAVYLASLGLDVTGVDQSSVGLAKAQRLATERRVKISTKVADLSAYDLGVEKWDGIVSIWCHLPSKLRKDVHARVIKALKPGGWFILEAYAPGQIALGTGGPKDPDMLAGLDELKQELLALEWYEARALRRQVQEGGFHGGESEVVQLVGRKAGGADGDAYEAFRCDCG